MPVDPEVRREWARALIGLTDPEAADPRPLFRAGKPQRVVLDGVDLSAFVGDVTGPETDHAC